MCTNAYFYRPPKQKQKGLNKVSDKAKANDRAGSMQEAKNHNSNKALLNGIISKLTPNSGAGHIKGDEQITGLLRIMEEFKTQNKILKGGKKTISIQKEWFDKLDREAPRENMEFWYLKFAYDDFDDQIYMAMKSEMGMSIIYTMSEDRKAKIEAEKKVDVAEKRARMVETQNIALLAEVEYLKAKLDEAGISYELNR
jgi:hypothetical protein